ncbi:hypothetical protein Hypma_003987 [Hypsizygus marmoreus]|uniref:Uncharacterized protein n=1 Tax=Hypsizygus marmoreus TaxID=39966 RepID=A0A369J885_HYPMA|nr:hypothetical protein Hypma_003987 [Hypsizygus marmoreus]
MNHDVDDTEAYLGDVERCAGGHMNRQKPHILSRIRNFNISSIGSAFSTPLSAMNSYVFQENSSASNGKNSACDSWNYAYDAEAARTPTGYDHHESYYDSYHQAVETSTPTQTRSGSPHQSTRLSDVKRIFNNFARSRQADHSHAQVDRKPNSVDRTTHLSSTDLVETPPLTPDTFDDYALHSPALSNNCEHIAQWNNNSTNQPLNYHDQDDADDESQYSRSHTHSLEIKEGKKPERPVCYDALIDDIPRRPNTATMDPNQSAGVLDDRDEWYGLEYTLELSCRDRLPSDTKSFSAGEHSKSRESWAAIHQGTIHPFFEDEDYYQWKNWHKYLDRQDERRKHKRGFEFKSRSKDLAWFYADEMRTRDVMYWQKEVYGVVARDLKDRLVMLTEYRSDPYSPAKKHNLGWYLKRSRSVACLRELCALPEPRQNKSPSVQVQHRYA